MCYPKPGPRCSNHAKEALAKAKKAYETDNENFEAYGKYQEALKDYYLTPAGIKELRYAGKHEEAQKNEAERKRLIEETKTVVAPADITKLDIEARKEAAWDPDTPAETLALLAEDEDRNVRLAVAYNPTTPPETLAKLTEDEERGIGTVVARHPNAPTEALTLLAEDENKFVRRDVALNPNTPPETLAKLTTDENEDVRRGARNNLSSR